MTVLVLLSSREKEFCPNRDRVLQATNESVLRNKLAKLVKLVEGSGIPKSIKLLICLANKNKENNPKYERLHHASAIRLIDIFFRGKGMDYDFLDCGEYSYDKCA